MNINTFTESANVNLARLANMLMTMFFAGMGEFPNAAVARVARFVRVHQRSFPVTPQTVHWQSLDALLTHVRNSGPQCSEADVAAAIQALPDESVALWLPIAPNYEG